MAPFPNEPRPYTGLWAIMVSANLMEQGQLLNNVHKTLESFRLTPLDEFTYGPTACMILKFVSSYESLKEPRKDRCILPILVPPIRSSYPDHPELLGTVEMRQHEKDDLVLSQLQMGILLQDKARFFIPPFDDEFTTIIRPVWRLAKPLC